MLSLGVRHDDGVALTLDNGDDWTAGGLLYVDTLLCIPLAIEYGGVDIVNPHPVRKVEVPILEEVTCKVQLIARRHLAVEWLSSSQIA